MPRSKKPRDESMSSEKEALDRRLARYVLSPKCEEMLKAAKGKDPRGRMIVEVNLDPEQLADATKEKVKQLLLSAGVPEAQIQPLDLSYNHVFVSLTLKEAQGVVRQDDESSKGKPERRLIRRIWPDPPLKPFIHRSVRTVKADACRVAFGSEGDGVVWAVADSGIEDGHPHFKTYKNLVLPTGLRHRSFLDGGKDADALVDMFGHGTHVAGVIAGETCPDKRLPTWRLGLHRDESNTVTTVVEEMKQPLRGIAVRCKLMSLKVIDDNGQGYASALIAALEYVARVNADGRHVRVHGVNLSLGYPFDAEWYAAGHSPLCTVVNRLSKDGVVVVAASGNDGAAFLQTEGREDTSRVGISMSINDPGNADEAITVGSTHADEPHRYGVSYFSSRGPTADGRMKPDLVAPGERILSCAATQSADFQAQLAVASHTFDPKAAYFREDTGTSMAAPHVSGAAAALMSVKAEAKGNSAMVKDLLVRSCTDLRRKADFQGAGLLDLLRALQLS